MKNQVTAKERMEAEEALRSLKQKMASAPKKPVKQSGQRGINQNNKKVSNNMNYGMDYDMEYGGGSNYNNYNILFQRKQQRQQ
jgi:hypothetical protein